MLKISENAPLETAKRGQNGGDEALVHGNKGKVSNNKTDESLYCDKKNAFVLTREPADAEVLAGILKPKSRSGKA